MKYAHGTCHTEMEQNKLFSYKMLTLCCTVVSHSPFHFTQIHTRKQLTLIHYTCIRTSTKVNTDTISKSKAAIVTGSVVMEYVRCAICMHVTSAGILNTNVNTKGTLKCMSITVNWAKIMFHNKKYNRQQSRREMIQI